MREGDGGGQIEREREKSERVKWKGQEKYGEKSERDRSKRRARREESKGESPFQEKRCWNAATEEEEERTKSEGATRRERS